MENEISNTFVVLMGVGTVFIGLVCIVLLCMLMSLVCRLGEKKKVEAAVVSAAPAIPVENRQEIIAAVAAAAAEDMGTDISAIRILSFKRK